MDVVGLTNRIFNGTHHSHVVLVILPYIYMYFTRTTFHNELKCVLALTLSSSSRVTVEICTTDAFSSKTFAKRNLCVCNATCQLCS